MPAAPGVGSFGRIVVACSELPDLLEDGTGKRPPSTLTSMLTGLYTSLITVSSSRRKRARTRLGGFQAFSLLGLPGDRRTQH